MKSYRFVRQIPAHRELVLSVLLLLAAGCGDSATASHDAAHDASGDVGAGDAAEDVVPGDASADSEDGANDESETPDGGHDASDVVDADAVANDTTDSSSDGDVSADDVDVPDAAVGSNCAELACSDLGRECVEDGSSSGASCGDCLLGWGDDGDGGCTPLIELTVTADDGLLVDVDEALYVYPGTAPVVRVTPDTGWALSPLVDGSCDEGMWDGETYTLPVIDEPCSVHFVAVVPVLGSAEWRTDAELPAGLNDVVSFVHDGIVAYELLFEADAVADQVVYLGWDWVGAYDWDMPANLAFYSYGPGGRSVVNVHEGRIGGPFALSGTVALTLRAGERFGAKVFNAWGQPIDGTVTLTTLRTTPAHTLTVVAPDGMAVAPMQILAAQDARPGFLVSGADPGASPPIPGGTCAPGEWVGPYYFVGAAEADCTIDFGAEADPAPPETDDPADEPGDHPNEAPILILGDELHLDTDPIYYTAASWAFVSPGPPREAAQQLSATLEVVDLSGNLTFDSPPTLDVATGHIGFATTPGTYGTATVEVTLRDDGGTAEGGVDTTTGSFAIRVNTPPRSEDSVIRYPARSPCVLVVESIWDPDATDFLGGDQVFVQQLSAPTQGFLTQFVMKDAGGDSAPVTTVEYERGGYWATDSRDPDDPQNRAVLWCYMPFLASFTGFDSYTYRVYDNHGGVSGTYSVLIELF